ncbi:MAG: HAMP domain-containing protein [Firmicutes bacterium]|nr:HAMP domain-containing protein [Bacillota bacterium]
MKFRSRILVSLLVVALVATAVTAGFSLFATSVYFSDYASNQRRARARELAALFSLYYERAGSWEGVQALLVFRGPGMGMYGQRRWATNVPGGMIDRILLMDETGIVVADSYGMQVGDRIQLRGLDSVPVTAGGRNVGAVAIVPGAPDPSGRVVASLENTFRRSVLAAALLAAAAGILLSFVLGASYSRDLMRRVASLAEASRRLAARDLSVRLPTGEQDELGQLASAFNEMAGALEKAEAVRRNMVADMAHEIRTPLAILRSNLEAMQAGLVEPTPDAVASLHDEVLRMSRLVADLQDLSLSEAGKLPLVTEEIELAAALERAAQAVGPQALSRSIEVSVAVPAGVPAALADGDRLMQVMMNLLSNALRYALEGGEVRIEAEPADAGFVQVCVSNNGEPISGEEIPHLFERFYRSDKSRNRQSGGTGLGLAVARALVEAMGGRIWVDASTGLTRFCFTLPVAPEKEG